MIKKIISAFFIFALILSIPFISHADDLSLPKYRGYTNDFARILNPETVNAIDSICAQVEKKTTAQSH